MGVYDALGASLCLCGLNRFNLGKEARKVVSSCSLLWFSVTVHMFVSGFVRVSSCVKLCVCSLALSRRLVLGQREQLQKEDIFSVCVYLSYVFLSLRF